MHITVSQAHSYQTRILKILIFFCTISFIVVSWLVWDYLDKREEIVNEAKKERAVKRLSENAKAIEKVFKKFLGVAETLAHDLSQASLNRQDLMSRLEKELKIHTDIYGIGVAFIPHIHKLDTSPHNSGGCHSAPPGCYYRVNRKSESEEKVKVLEIIRVPFSYRDVVAQERVAMGSVFIEYTVEDIKKLISEWGEAGYGFILAEKGKYIAHPIDEYVKDKKTIFDISTEKDDEELWQIGESMVQGATAGREYLDQVTGQSSWIFYQPIPTTSWMMAGVFMETSELATLRLKLIRICPVVIWFFILLIALILRVDRGHIDDLWEMMIFASCLTIVGIGFIWNITQTTDLEDYYKKNVPILGQEKLRIYLKDYEKKLTQGKKLYQIPTGIFIDSIEFEGDNNVILTGYIWQKYHSRDIREPNLQQAGDEKKIPDFILAEAKSIEQKETYRSKNNEIIGWRFEASIRQKFDYSRYPFDSRELNLHISHDSFDDAIILVPDLEAYDIINPSFKPGIKPELTLPNWTVKKSFFNYQTHDYSTNFGISSYREDAPKLYFTVAIQRQFLNPFIKDIITLFVIAVILFIVQMLLEQAKLTNVLGPLSALFFSILLAHIRLRSELNAPNITYIEYLYFVIYWNLLMVTITFFLFHSNTNIVFIKHHNGLIQNLLYWPLTLNIILIITAITFSI